MVSLALSMESSTDLRVPNVEKISLMWVSFTLRVKCPTWSLVVWGASAWPFAWTCKAHYAAGEPALTSKADNTCTEYARCIVSLYAQACAQDVWLHSVMLSHHA